MSRAITDKMTAVESDVRSKFRNLYCIKDLERLLIKAKSAPSDAKPHILRRLAIMINESGTPCDFGKSVDYYRKKIASLSLPLNENALSDKLIETLCEIYSFYPSPEDFMTRIVNSIDPDTALSASLQLRILRRFMSTVNVKENKKYYVKSAVGADPLTLGESLFDEGALDAKDPMRAMVKGCGDLAHGRFISPAYTKELLYLFAFAYGMRYYHDDTAQDYDVARDVEKNLFADYYSDNLTRYLHFEYDARSGCYDKEPSGLGINPKSFIDVCFVYYLNKDGLTAQERVSGFYSMIEKVKTEWKKEHEFSEGGIDRFNGSSLTGTYRTKLYYTVPTLSEDSLQRFLLDNYYCDVRYSYTNKKTGDTAQGSKGSFELQFTNNTAYDGYLDILELIKYSVAESTSAYNVDFSAAIADLDRRKSSNSATFELLDSLMANVPEIGDNPDFSKPIKSEEDREKFNIIAKNIEKRLDPYEALGVAAPADITRSKLIAAYYHYYCLENGEGSGDDERWTNFSDVYDHLGSSLNSYLTEAGYQRLNPKNIFDMFVVFLAYCNINQFSWNRSAANGNDA